MSEVKRLLKNTAVIAIGNFGAKTISFLLLPFYTAVFSTSDYGMYDYILALSAFLSPIVTLSATEAMFRFIVSASETGTKKFKETLTNAFAIVVLGIFAFTVVSIILYEIFNVGYVGYVWLNVISGILYSCVGALLRGTGRLRLFAVASSCKNIIIIIINVIVVLVFHKGVYGLLFSTCFVEVLTFLVVFCMSRMWREIDLKTLSFGRVMEMLRYSLPLVPNSICGTIINVSDRLVISNVMGTSANGVYSISYKFPNMVETVYHFFSLAWGESASRVYEKANRDEAEKYYLMLYKNINALVYSTILIMIAGMSILFRIFIRGDYVQSFSYIPLLMFAMYFQCIGNFFSGLFIALKNTKVVALSTFVAACINMIINLLFVERIGLYAAAGSTLIACMVMAYIKQKMICRKIEMKLERSTCVLQIIVAILIIPLYSYTSAIKIFCAILISVIYAIYANHYLLNVIFNTLKQKKV